MRTFADTSTFQRAINLDFIDDWILISSANSEFIWMDRILFLFRDGFSTTQYKFKQNIA